MCIVYKHCQHNIKISVCYYIYIYVCVYHHIIIKKVDKQLNVVYGTIRYGRCSRNPLSGPLVFIYNNIYLYIYILIITTNCNVLSILKIKLYF